MQFYELDKDMLEQNLSIILCAPVGYSDMLMMDTDYIPETFTVEDKRNGRRMPFFTDITFDSWIQSMIEEQVRAVGLSQEDTNIAVYVSIRNLLVLLDRCKGLYPVYNQEFVDVIRHITAYTVYGDFSCLISTARDMNRFADHLIPLVITRLKQENLTEEEWFTLSVISGISGLDMKGAPAAASVYSNDGIPLRPLLSMPVEKAGEAYADALLTVQNRYLIGKRFEIRWKEAGI